LQAKWSARIGAGGIKIGIVWQGNPNPEADTARSFPVAALQPVAALPRVRLISLQRGFGTEQLDGLPQHIRVETLGSEFDAGTDAFIDTAAVITALDLVVTCDRSIAHLPGALGAPVWVALKKDAEWRWLRQRDDSPWYPTMRLFRQPLRGDWSSVFTAMAHRLAPLAHTPRKPAHTIVTPIAIGELIDKITILEIKAQRIADERKLNNVRHELALVAECQVKEAIGHPRLDALKTILSRLNAELWDIEDRLRLCEQNGDFGAQFVTLARAVYRTNDRRAAIKLEINRLFNSTIVEEKSYV
jgi:hypothetical protein